MLIVVQIYHFLEVKFSAGNFRPPQPPAEINQFGWATQMDGLVYYTSEREFRDRGHVHSTVQRSELDKLETKAPNQSSSISDFIIFFKKTVYSGTPLRVYAKPFSCNPSDSLTRRKKLLSFPSVCVTGYNSCQ